MKLSVICVVGIGALVLASGGAWYALRDAAEITPAPVLAAIADPLPLTGDWHSVDSFVKLQETTAVAAVAEDQDQVALRAERQAELRARLQPPLLPLTLVADYAAKASPKSHWGDGADTSLTGSRPSPRNPSEAEQATTETVDSAVTEDSLVSSHARETVAMLEAFKTALQDTGGAEKFQAATAVTPYSDR